MKASKRCPKCQSMKIGYLEQLRDGDPGDGEGPTPRAVGFSRHSEESFLGLVYAELTSIGELEAYICAECGYFEHYVKAPESVSFDKIQGFHWLNPEAVEEGPYR